MVSSRDETDRRLLVVAVAEDRPLVTASSFSQLISISRLFPLFNDMFEEEVVTHIIISKVDFLDCFLFFFMRSCSWDKQQLLWRLVFVDKMTDAATH